MASPALLNEDSCFVSMLKVSSKLQHTLYITSLYQVAWCSCRTPMLSCDANHTRVEGV